MGDATVFIRRYTMTACVGLACVALAINLWRRSREDPPPTFDLGSSISVVSIRAANGKFLEVSPEDGLVRATASDDAALAARFRILVLSAATVAALKLASSSVGAFASETSPVTTTISGCQCSGFSNEHGFGRYCHSWETDMRAHPTIGGAPSPQPVPDRSHDRFPLGPSLCAETPWCYVDELCKGASVSGGSFGRRHDECRQPWERLDAAATSAEGGDAAAAAHDTDAPPVDVPNPALEWTAPPGCPCSGVTSPLGFGAACKGWEFVGQTPWCYVFDNCTQAAVGVGTRGSFGRRYLECVLTEAAGAAGEAGRQLSARSHPHQPLRGPAALAGILEGAQGAVEGTAGASGESRTSTFQIRRLGESLRSAHAGAVAVEEGALLERVERLRQPHVALVSLATEGFVSVELPPHRFALRPHARTDGLSLRSVFSFLPSGALMSLATNALLNLCGPVANEPAGPDADGAVCTGFGEEGSAHYKLLRAPIASSIFKVARRERQATPQQPVSVTSARRPRKPPA